MRTQSNETLEHEGEREEKVGGGRQKGEKREKKGNGNK